MSFDFAAGAGAATNSDLIPAGQLAFAILQVRAVKASASGGQYLDVELTIDEGQPYGRKKLWDMIGDPTHAGNTEGYRQMGLIAITRILEAGNNAGPHNMPGYVIDDTKTYAKLNGLRVAIKIGIEKGTNGRADKNKVADYLTPNPASQSGYKAYAKLLAGEFAPAGSTNASPAAAQSGFAGFGAAAPAATPSAGSGFGSGGSAAPASGFGTASAQTVADRAGATTDSASTTPATEASPSDQKDPAATPTWLSQAG